jgi:hypothetical protein
MSREERRAYQRMMKNRDPYALPAPRGAKRGLEQRAERRSRARQALVQEPFITRRFALLAFGSAALVGVIAFSLQWPNMPFAAYLGAGVALVWVLLAAGFRWLQRRAAASATRSG